MALNAISFLVIFRHDYRADEAGPSMKSTCAESDL